MIEPRLTAGLRRLQADLSALRIPWALVGGLAVSARAEPRTTRDIDVAIAVADDREAEDVVQRLRGRGYLDEVVMEHEVGRLATVRLTRRGDPSNIFLDLLFASSGIEPEVVQNAERLEVLPGLYTPVARVSDLLALKVLALRPKRPEERPQDFTDIRELLRVAGEHDLRQARLALELIARRGYDRGKDLEVELEKQIRRFRQGQRADG